jgi:glycosyltransferase involved in cell wall biosynthesis
VYAQAFARAGHDVEIISLSAFEAEPDGVPVRQIGDQSFDRNATESRWQYVRAIRPLRKAVRELQPDVLFALYMSSAGLVACLSGHPHVVVSAQGTDVNKRLDSLLWKLIFRWESRRASWVHAVSDDLAQKLRDTFRVAPQKILVSPIGIDTESLPYVEPSTRPSSGVIVSTRAHDAVYDQPTVARAVRRLRERGVPCSVVFASGRQVDATKRVVEDLGIGDVVRFLGGFHDDELSSILAASDVYVSCSHSDGTSQSLLEALSTGTFPIVTDIVANRPWVSDGRTGFLFPVGDDAALADRLEEALAAPGLRREASQRLRQAAVDGGDVNRLAVQLLERFRPVGESARSGRLRRTLRSRKPST